MLIKRLFTEILEWLFCWGIATLIAIIICIADLIGWLFSSWKKEDRD